jgi:iron complex transport system permease protein
MRFWLFFALFCFSLVIMAFALRYGSTSLSWQQLWHDPSSQEILFKLRLPHVLSAFVTGGLLALAGAMMQALLRNPLADPYILGISSGAAVVSLCCMLAGLSDIWITCGAWAGSFFAVIFVFAWARHKQTHALLLTGIALASVFSGFISLILLISPDRALHGMLFWLLGDLSDAALPISAAPILLLGLLLAMLMAKPLNLFVHSETRAATLGIHTKQLQWQLYFLSALLTATAVSLAGCIGFVGLIVPHIWRLLFGYDHRWLFPGCVLLGGTLLTLTDLLARTLLAPQQLPVGIVMALLGAPVFLILLRRQT